MNKKVLTDFVFLTLMAVLLSAMPVQAQSAAYFQAMTNLNPAGYWPMHEVEAPAPGDIETNWGTLGVLGNGYYADYAGITTNIGHGYAGALTNCLNSGDTAVNFESSAGVANNNFVIIPHTSPLMTLGPPFTAEAWVKCTGSPTSTAGMAFIGEGGNNGLNNVKIYDGFQCSWGYNMLTAQYYTGGNNTFTSFSTQSNYTASVWWHYVATYDGTNVLTYVNGLQEASGTLTTMVPSKWSPLCIGSGKYSAGPNRAYPGYVDEVAIYTNVLSPGQIGNHHLAGTTTGSNYFQTVLNDNPLLYYHMDAPAYTAPSVGTWPALTNYGSVAGNGVYTPGSTPGSVRGPSNPSGVPWGGLLGTNAAPGNGMSSFGDAGNNALYNPTGSGATFSVSAMFQGNPADPRVQSIVGHGSNSWQLVLNANGQIVFNAGTGGGTGAGSSASGDLTASITNNDGNWHQVVAVHNGTNNWLYVDGALNASNSSTVSIPGSAQDVMIGADPSFISNNVTQTASDALGKQFAGQVCEVAFFTNALTSNQVQTLYNASGVPVFITTQPVSASVNQGAGFTNTVVAGGSALAYQWYTNGVALPNQTNASLILNPVLPSYASTNYYVVVTNGYGSVTSAVVSLTVFSIPIIVSQLPAAHTNVITLFAGASPTFSVSATGALPLYYFWVTNGVVVAGATNTSYTNAQAISLTNFYCIVSNFVGTATGTVWTVSVISDPTAPYPVSVLAAHPIGYWRLNEGPDDGNGDQGVICNDYLGGNNGIYTNVTLAQPGYSATDPTETSAMFGDGYFANSDVFNIPTNVDFGAPASSLASFSVEAWVKGYIQQTADAGIVSKGVGGGGEQFDLDTGSDTISATNPIAHSYRFFFRDAASNAHIVNSSVNPMDGQWHHLVGVCNATNGLVVFYIDGLPVGSTNFTPGLGVLASTNSMLIGSRPSGTTINSNDWQFVGWVQDVAVYNYALSSNQVAAQYASAGVTVAQAQQSCIPEPMMQGQDPDVALGNDGYFNLVQSDGCNIRLRRSTNWAGLVTADNPVIYAVGCSNLWAPDLEFISNSWYLYYSVDTGSSGNERVHVAQSSGSDPSGPYTELGVLYNNWNIDGNVFTSTDGKLYFICAAQPNEEIYIAPMSNPYTLSASPTVISSPTKSWECVGSCINEGPFGFVHSNKVFIVYSASKCESNEYCLGLLTLTGANILSSSSWTKSGPVFTQQPGAYGPAGDGVLQDAAGQWWFTYHANDFSGQGCGGHRQLRVQRLYWKTNNVPDFGTPVPIGSLLTDGTNFMAAEFPLTETSGTSAGSIGCSEAGELMGTPVWAMPGLTLNGVTDYVDCGPEVGNDVQQNLTLAAWIRADAFIDWGGIIIKGTTNSPYALQTWHDGTLRFTANWGSPAGGTNSGSWNSNTKMTTNQWYHVAVTYDGATIRFYINAVLDSNQPAASLRFGVVDQSLIIGADFPVTNEYFKGTIRDVRVYGRALGAAEISNISGFGTPPVFQASGIGDHSIGAGQYLWVTNTATEPEAPPQTLSYSLLTGPSNAQVDPVSGVLSWRPTVNQACSVNPFAIVVADNGSPSLSATNAFSVTVTNLTLPYLDSMLFNSGVFQFRVSGDFGPDYVLQATTNLNSPVMWMPLITNLSPIPPFLFNDPGASNYDSRFYRIQLGP